MKDIGFFKALNLSQAKVFIHDDSKEYPGKWQGYSPEIVGLIDEYEASGKYPYNRVIERLSCQKLFHEILEADSEEMLSTIVYNSQSYRHARQKQEHKDKMIQAGYLELSEDIVRQAIKEKKKIQIKATVQNDWAVSGFDKILKPVEFNGKLSLMPLKARTKGYSLSQFENAFCKLI